MTYRHYITFIGMLFCLYFKMAAQSFCYEGKVVMNTINRYQMYRSVSYEKTDRLSILLLLMRRDGFP